MGHIRLGRLPQSKKWRAVVDLLEGDGDLLQIAGAAAEASATDLKITNNDPLFQYIARLLVELPLYARGPAHNAYLSELGLTADEGQSAADGVRVRRGSGYNVAYGWAGVDPANKADLPQIADSFRCTLGFSGGC